MSSLLLHDAAPTSTSWRQSPAIREDAMDNLKELQDSERNLPLEQATEMYNILTEKFTDSEKVSLICNLISDFSILFNNLLKS